MSAGATFWAWKQSTTSAQKLTLLALANCHNEGTGQCNPSISYISSATGLNRKTVIKSIAELEALGLIVAEKTHGGSTQYTIQASTNTGTSTEIDTSTKNGTHTGTKIGTGTSTKNGTQPVPKLGHESKKNLKDESKIESKKVKPNITPSELKRLNPLVDPSIIDQWFVVRKDKKAPTLTKRAWDKFLKESAKAEVSVQEALEHCVDNHWRGFEASWLTNKNMNRPPQNSGMRVIKPFGAE